MSCCREPHSTWNVYENLTFCRYQGAWTQSDTPLIEWTAALGGWALQIVKRLGDVCGFTVLPKRRIVERRFAWFGRYRRLSKDYETLTQSSETVIYPAMIHRMARRLKPAA